MIRVRADPGKSIRSAMGNNPGEDLHDLDRRLSELVQPVPELYKGYVCFRDYQRTREKITDEDLTFEAFAKSIAMGRGILAGVLLDWKPLWLLAVESSEEAYDLYREQLEATESALREGREAMDQKLKEMMGDFNPFKEKQ